MSACSKITPRPNLSPQGHDIHTFRPPPDGAVRSPCPALNALANHSYLPHDGRNITFIRLFASLRAGFGLSRSLALVLAAGSFILLRRPSLAPFTLHQSARHNFIEHNASIIHDDAPIRAKYAPTDVNLALLQRFLGRARRLHDEENEAITMYDIARSRVEREALCAPLSALHAEIARGEFSMVIELFGRGSDKHLDRRDLEVFLLENRFPAGWSPECKLRLREVVARAKMMRQAMRLDESIGNGEGTGGTKSPSADARRMTGVS